MENRKNIKLIGKNVFESTGFHITRTLFITTQVYRVISTIRKNLVNIIIPAGIYLFKVNSRNTTARCEICSKLTIKTRERWQWHRSGVLIVNFEHISHLVLVLLLLTLNKYLPAGLEIVKYYLHYQEKYGVHVLCVFCLKYSMVKN